MTHATTTTMRRARSVATGLLMLAGLSVASVGPISAAPAIEPVELLTRKVNEYEGQHRLAAGGDTYGETAGVTRKVNEYEGQHR